MSREEDIRRRAFNRYQMRLYYNFRNQDTAEDDWYIAESEVRDEDRRKCSMEIDFPERRKEKR